jgi:uncharacterized membrane protein
MNEFLGNMETRGTWQSFNESHCWHTCIVESCTIYMHHKLLSSLQTLFRFGHVLNLKMTTAPAIVDADFFMRWFPAMPAGWTHSTHQHNKRIK